MSDLTIPTEKIREADKAKRVLETAYTNFAYNVLRHYDIPTTWKFFLGEKKLVVTTEGTLGGKYTSFHITYGCLASLYVILHEIAHYIDHIKQIKLLEKEVRKKEEWTIREWAEMELKVGEFAGKEFSRWNNKYKKEVFSYQLDYYVVM